MQSSLHRRFYSSVSLKGRKFDVCDSEVRFQDKYAPGNKILFCTEVMSADIRYANGCVRCCSSPVIRGGLVLRCGGRRCFCDEPRFALESFEQVVQVLQGR